MAKIIYTYLLFGFIQEFIKTLNSVFQALLLHNKGEKKKK